MSKKTKKSIGPVCTSENVLKPKVILYFMPFLITFLLIGAIVGAVLGFVDIDALIEKYKEGGSEKSEQTQETLYVNYEYISDESEAPQYTIEPNGIYTEISGTYELPYDGTAKTFKIFDGTGNEVDSSAYTYSYFTSDGVAADPIERGDYKVVADDGNGNTYELNFKIVKGTITLPDDIKFESVTVTYDGNEHEIAVEGELPTGVSVYYNNPTKAIDAGEYTVVATFIKDDNYNSATLEATLTIEKADAPFTVEFKNADIDYDGSTHTLDITVDGDGIIDTDIVYTDSNGNVIETPTNAGVYTATATITSKNYKDYTATAVLTINKVAAADGFYKHYIVFNETTVKFNTKAQTITPVLNSEASDAGIQIISIEAPECINVGEYEISAKFSSTNYLDETITVKLIIEKADFDYLKNGYVFKNTTIVFNGKEQIIEVKSPDKAPAGVLDLAISYKNNAQTEVGKYTATAVIKSANYNDVTLTASFKIINRNDIKTQTIPFDVKKHLPDIGSIIALPEGTDVDALTVSYFLIVNDEETICDNGIRKIGEYHFKVAVTDASNNYSEHFVNLKISINPIFILITAGVGLAIGSIIALLGYILYCKKISAKKFKSVKEFIISEKIIAESYAKVSSGYGKGRLYFTNTGLEFYSKKFGHSPDLKINISEIRSVNFTNQSKFNIYIKNDIYKITVPKGSAKVWVDALINY